MNAIPLGRWLLGGLLLALLLPGDAAEAVIPSAFGPIQALIAILPQLLMAFAALLVALFKPRTYRLLGGYLWAHKIFTLLLVSTPVLLLWAPWGAASGPVTQEQKGASWPAFRGGPLRSGAVPGAAGPQSQPYVAWRFLPPSKVGVDIDSSPALVGNRVYVGIHHKSILGTSSGSLCSIDAGTGRIAWQFDGAGELTPSLGPIFSSPVVWAENGAARYVVTGEGYHYDKNCRLFCLDLKGGKPTLRWSVQTTSHVESTPCIHDGRVYVGAGDDGLWCVELETGKVLWRLEGMPFYEIAGPKAGALTELEGKTVVATGPVARVDLGARNKDDPGRLTIEVQSFREHSGPPVTGMDSGRTFDRTVTGKVVCPKDGKPRIEVAASFPDCESAPVANDSIVLFGTGLGGPHLNGADPRTGALLWKTPTPFPAFAPPTLAGDRVLIGVGNGTFIESDPNPAGALLCLSLKDGKPLWTVKMENSVFGAAAVHDGRAYACSRDGHVYVVDLEKGTVLAKHNAGAAMVCSPAVTADAIYVVTGAGKVLCLDRQKGGVRWTQNASPGSMIISSPAASAGKLFVGTQGKGLLCIADRPAEETAAGPARPWSGPGGGADRTGAADDKGPPEIQGEESVQKWDPPAALQRSVVGPVIACGERVYVPFTDALACVEPKTGTIAWESAPVRAMVADPDRLYAIAGNELHALDPASGKPLWKTGVSGEALALGGKRLLVSRTPASIDALDAATGGPLWSREAIVVGAPAPVESLVIVSTTGGLLCLDIASGAVVWKADLGSPPVGPPTIVQERVYVAAAGKVHARSLLDGSPIWKAGLDEAVKDPLSATEAYVAVPCEEKMVVLHAADGKEKASLPVGKAPRTGTFHGTLLIMSAEARIAAHDLGTGEWPWNYKDQDHIGAAASPPVLLGRTIWVGTSARGLVAIGTAEKK